MFGKILFPVFVLILSIPALGQKTENITWDKSLEVETGNESFGDDTHHAYTITIYDVNDNFVSGGWKDHVKDKGGKVSTKKGVASVEQMSLPEVHPAPLDVHAKFEQDKKNDAVRMTVAFVQDGTAINPEDHPEAHDNAQAMMYDLSVQLNRAAVGQQLEEQEKELEKMEKDLEKLKKDNEKLHDDIDKNGKNYSKAIDDQGKAEKDLSRAKEEVTAFQAEIGTSGDSKQLKELSKMKKDIDNLEKKITNLKDDQSKYQNAVSDAEKAIPKNEEEQQELMEQITAQKELIEKYRQKQEAVK